jgi:hypothetical protein
VKRFLGQEEEEKEVLLSQDQRARIMSNHGRKNLKKKILKNSYW